MYRCRYLGVCPFSPKLMGVFLATTLVLHSTALSVSARLVLYRRVASFVVMCFFPSAPSQAGGEGQQTGFCSSHTVSVLFHIRKICAIESSAKSWHWHRQESFPIVGELNVASPSSATWISVAWMNLFAGDELRLISILAQGALVCFSPSHLRLEPRSRSPSLFPIPPRCCCTTIRVKGLELGLNAAL